MLDAALIVHQQLTMSTLQASCAVINAPLLKRMILAILLQDCWQSRPYDNLLLLCYQVWMALLEKRIPFDVIFIELFDKPDWYERIVPTKLVPALRLTSSGDVICESYDILKVRYGSASILIHVFARNAMDKVIRDASKAPLGTLQHSSLH